MRRPPPDPDPLVARIEGWIYDHRRWRGRRVFYQVLAYELAPILKDHPNPVAFQARVRELLVKHGHAPEAPPLPPPRPGFNDAAHLVASIPDRGRDG